VTSTIQIVPMTAGHIDAVMTYEHEMFGTESWTADMYREELADERERYYLAGLGPSGELVGWAGIRIVGREAEIMTIGVIPSARRQGIAIRLLHAVLDEARRSGATVAFLEVRVDNAAAMRLYEREGFAVIGRRRGYYAGGRVDAITMRRDV
jgi:[ribosomal protein S18]-alanine N-acetyltransferase